MNQVQLGSSDLRVTPVCLGTMTFGEQVDEATSHAILDRSLERGINFLDTAEMYAVPARAETFGATESIIGNWLARDNGLTPTQLALAFCYTQWQVASTIIGVTSVAQLDEDLDAYGTTLDAGVLEAFDKIRWEIRDPAL
ncbi:MAG: aldo/keto reductase [Burkholderiales bacterium]|nr:aldo/keto reductase [Burkholderiales bacterium]